MLVAVSVWSSAADPVITNEPVAVSSVGATVMVLVWLTDSAPLATVTLNARGSPVGELDVLL